MQVNKIYKKIINLLIPWFIPFFILLFWIISSNSGFIPEYILPHPSDVLKTASHYFFGSSQNVPYNARFISDFSVSILRVFLGFAIAALIGIPLALLTGRRKNFNRLFTGIINGVRAVPGITWLPLALIWFGIGLKTTVFLISLAAFFPVYINTHTAVTRFNERFLQAGEMMGLTKKQKVFHILLPGTSAQILAGLRLGLGISWAYLVLGELTGVPNGMGAVIMDARLLGRVDMIIIGIITIAVIGKLSDVLLIKTMSFSFKSVRRLNK
jgi:NitT/TauT family transport system permease protein